MPKKDTKKRKSQLQNLKPVARNCPFCKGKIEPDYKDYQGLARYISDRAKILGKDRTGLCAKHQRRITIAIKRARNLGLVASTAAI